METLLKTKGLWKYTKFVILYSVNGHDKCFINGNKDEVVGVIMTYISREIHFHTSKIGCPDAVWSKLNSFFYKVNKSQVMKIGKELISLEPNSIELLRNIYLTSRRYNWNWENVVRIFHKRIDISLK